MWDPHRSVARHLPTTSNRIDYTGRITRRSEAGTPAQGFLTITNEYQAGCEAGIQRVSSALVRIQNSSSMVSRTRRVISAGSSSTANGASRSKPCGPVMITRTSPPNGSVAIHPSYRSVRCRPPATTADSVRSRRSAGIPLQSNGQGHQRRAPTRSHDLKPIRQRPPLVQGACFGAVVSSLSVPGAGQTARFIEPMLLLRNRQIAGGHRLAVRGLS
jgi:hypothetical protein